MHIFEKAKETEDTELVGTPCIVCNFHDFTTASTTEMKLLCYVVVVFFMTSRPLFDN